MSGSKLEGGGIADNVQVIRLGSQQEELRQSSLRKRGISAIGPFTIGGSTAAGAGCIGTGEGIEMQQVY